MFSFLFPNYIFFINNSKSISPRKHINVMRIGWLWSETVDYILLQNIYVVYSLLFARWMFVECYRGNEEKPNYVLIVQSINLSLSLRVNPEKMFKKVLVFLVIVIVHFRFGFVVELMIFIIPNFFVEIFLPWKIDGT